MEGCRPFGMRADFERIRLCFRFNINWGNYASGNFIETFVKYSNLWNKCSKDRYYEDGKRRFEGENLN